MASLGASAVLVFAVPASPLAQPWSVIGGNFLSALVGVSCACLIHEPVAATAIAVVKNNSTVASIPDPADLVRRAARSGNRRGALLEATSPPRRRQADQDIVPRAWRGRSGPQRAE